MSFHPYHTITSIHTAECQKAESQTAESQKAESQKEDCEASKEFFKPPTKQHPVSRSLSHKEEAYELSKVYFDQCKEGDTVLANFFIDRDQFTTVEYYKKENGKMVLHRIDAPYDEINITWTYQATDFVF